MTAAAVPLYQRIKSHIEDMLESGTWAHDQRIPSENQLARQFSASRMTVNRAIRELTAEGRLKRRQGSGTFVDDPRPGLDLLQIRNIADEIQERGHDYSCTVRYAGEEEASRTIADALEIKPGGRVFHSIIIHNEDGVPMQMEDRYVNPAVAPDYLSVDFTQTTPNAHLMALGLAGIEHTLEAILPDDSMQASLRIEGNEPCLLLHRRTWTGDQVASRAWLVHPGSRYRLTATVMNNGTPQKTLSTTPPLPPNPKRGTS